jgi:predicted NodU family carbamoyl transferase
MKSLLLTLGHNSSAVMVEDGEVLWGYETERVTGTKSDSRFPKAVLDHAKLFDLDYKPDNVYVSHWSPAGNLFSMSPKHWDPAEFSGVPIRSLDPDMTHHDAHMAGAVCYAGPHFPYGRNTFGVVVDGFGIYGEHFSIYRLIDRTKPQLIERVHGYGTSLGLWYQYATAFMGMKMHEDEYKLLGYEVHVTDSDRAIVDMLVDTKVTEWLDDMSRSVYGSEFDPAYNLDALAAAKDSIFRHLNDVCRVLKIDDPSSYAGRCSLAYYVQAVLEGIVLRKVEKLGAHHLILSGGCFYNVKLNKRLLDEIDGMLCVYPLAGDQGNGIGLYAADNPSFRFPRNLNWGRRKLTSMGVVQNLHVVDEAVGLVRMQELIEAFGYANLVRGDMEFGPRALCNTSTLAIPTMTNVRDINHMNDRNTVMPMAPVVTEGMYHEMFERADHVWRSQYHMIVAMEYREYPAENVLGVSHEYNGPRHHHTGRPQVTSDPFMSHLLRHFRGPLINTSFNYHGMPIALGMDSIIKNHTMQLKRNSNIHTVVIQNA